MNTEKQEEVKENGQVTLRENGSHIHLLSIIGEIEGHECAPASAKTTKYEHVLPQLAAIEDDPDIEGLLILINTVGGDISAGLALAEMIASLSCPTVSLVLGDSHSIGVPLAVSTDYSLIVPTGTMIIHPVRMTGMVIGAPQTYDYFKLMQERILSFIAGHCRTPKEKLEAMMLNTGMHLQSKLSHTGMQHTAWNLKRDRIQRYSAPHCRLRPVFQLVVDQLILAVPAVQLTDLLTNDL